MNGGEKMLSLPVENPRFLMRGLKYTILAVVAAFVMPFGAEVSGQSLNTLNSGRGDFGDMNFQTPDGASVGTNPFQTDDEPLDSTRMDTTKKERKPLESYFFNDSIRSRNNFAWNISMSRNRIEMTRIDTVLYDFQVDYPFLKKDVGDAYLGNLGAPSVPLGFYARPQFRDFQMAQPMYAYLYTPESAPFYNVKKPLTRLGYITAGQRQYAEENISILHAQNITPSTGFNVTYHTMGTRGIYVNQATRDTDFSLGVSHTGKRYTGYAGYIFNTIRMQENGGVVDDWYVTGVKKERPFEIPFMLSDAKNIMKNNTFYTFHSYGIPLRRLTDEDFSMPVYRPSMWGTPCSTTVGAGSIPTPIPACSSPNPTGERPMRRCLPDPSTSTGISTAPPRGTPPSSRSSPTGCSCSFSPGTGMPS